MYKDLNSLYRSFNPKMVTYESDGAGRDSYISCDNGGMKKISAKEMRPSTTNLSYNTHSHIYKLR